MSDPLPVPIPFLLEATDLTKKYDDGILALDHDSIGV